jgi:DNA-binding CsgD family transcriptional regulator
VDYLLDWDDLYKTIDSLYDGYYTNLRSRYSDVLNEREMQLCCLLKADFSTKEISFVTQQSVRTVYQRKSSVRQKLNMEEKEDIAQFLS